ncbi:putative sensory transduction regulator [Bradyrhizobium macuxiense]|uniref:Putative sensory transduction regulator n=1 Tax=Bradyrhizobium macuxiense TaxID=1755647 RepID=A0A560LM19_9BRAD|nr:YbjN domain-containing protein [Bradyrhizobium macuxiense]TWB96269.1 putative sensory transduction regulator [Bradyrhizobium macuxiense]
MSETITRLTIEGLRDSFQSVGYRVETLTDPVANTTYLRSATAGLGFEIRPGNQLVGEEQSFVDATLVTTLQVQGELPLDLVNRWNTTRRFGRLQYSQPFLMFCLDVSVAGGVAPNFVRAQIEIWDRLVQELIAYLREELPKLAVRNGATAAAPQPAAPAQQPSLERAAEAEAVPTIQ